jgi:hypothetical protein
MCALELRVRPVLGYRTTLSTISNSNPLVYVLENSVRIYSMSGQVVLMHESMCARSFQQWST